MKQYYEVHITMQGEPIGIKASVEHLGWKFSAIEGDPDLGKGIRCYATYHFPVDVGKAFVQNKLMRAANFLEQECKIEVLRKKIELIVFDSLQKEVA